jgi:hypothetical protein
MSCPANRDHFLRVPGKVKVDPRFPISMENYQTTQGEE